VTLCPAGLQLLSAVHAQKNFIWFGSTLKPSQVEIHSHCALHSLSHWN